MDYLPSGSASQTRGQDSNDGLGTVVVGMSGKADNGGSPSVIHLPHQAMPTQALMHAACSTG